MSFNLQLINRFKELMPKLLKDSHKGQSGRIGIVGGSKEYTGAPYFASISALRAGADLAYVFTTREAAAVIKTYSPELIVLPMLDAENNELEMHTWIGKVHSLVIGPGLGRSEPAFKYFRTAVACAKTKNIPIVIDADGLFILSYDVSLVSGYKKCLLTPNFMEFKRLYDETFKEELQQETSYDGEYDETKRFKSVQAQSDAVRRLAARLNNVTILKKGQIDIISNGIDVVTNDAQGSLKRCGGIGDILTGTLGSFVYWTHSAMPDLAGNDPLKQPGILAAYAASTLVKECSRQAFEKFRRSLLAVDVIEQIPQQVYRLFDQND